MRFHPKLALLLSALSLFFCVPVHSQTEPQSSSPSASAPGSMSGMDMGDMDHEDADSGASNAANDAMSDMHMDMGPHMYMTALRPPNHADEQRAAQIVVIVREAIEKYKDYHVALADGFKIFGPNVPQDQYHFTNYANALKAQFVFDPTHPTSLLYKKTADGYELVGAMFTAPRSYTEDQLNQRVPLSVARWHQHVNLCFPPRGVTIAQANWKEFGLRGSIATEQACAEAGGRWHAVVLNWMVHVYPFRSDPSKIWAH